MKGLYSPQYEHDACGVGTIAAGVAKAKADKILVSGCDGGPGLQSRPYRFLAALLRAGGAGMSGGIAYIWDRQGNGWPGACSTPGMNICRNS